MTEEEARKLPIGTKLKGEEGVVQIISVKEYLKGTWPSGGKPNNPGNEWIPGRYLDGVYKGYVNGFSHGSVSHWTVIEAPDNICSNTQCPICSSAAELVFYLHCSNPSCQNYRG